MRALLLGISALAVALPVPSVAQTAPSDVRFSARSSSGHHGGFKHHDRRRHRDHDRDHHRHRDRDRDRDDDDGFFYDYYREYQGDTTWRSDSFNDWWHDRPDRAYPRWMVANQNCDRQWYAGNTLRC